MRNNSCSKPEFQSVGYCYLVPLLLCCANTIRATGYKRKTSQPSDKVYQVTKGHFGNSGSILLSPLSVLGCRLVPLSFVTGAHKPLEKSFCFKVGKFPLLFQVHFFPLLLPYCTSPACVCVTVQLILCLSVKCSWLLELLR